MFTEVCCQLCLNNKAVFSFHQSMFKREHHRYADLADDGERSIGLM